MGWLSCFNNNKKSLISSSVTYRTSVNVSIPRYSANGPFQSENLFNFNHSSKVIVDKSTRVRADEVSFFTPLGGEACPSAPSASKNAIFYFLDSTKLLKLV